MSYAIKYVTEWDSDEGGVRYEPVEPSMPLKLSDSSVMWMRIPARGEEWHCLRRKEYCVCEPKPSQSGTVMGTLGHTCPLRGPIGGENRPRVSDDGV